MRVPWLLPDIWAWHRDWWEVQTRTKQGLVRGGTGTTTTSSKDNILRWFPLLTLDQEDRMSIRHRMSNCPLHSLSTTLLIPPWSKTTTKPTRPPRSQDFSWRYFINLTYKLNLLRFHAIPFNKLLNVLRSFGSSYVEGIDHWKLPYQREWVIWTTV